MAEGRHACPDPWPDTISDWQGPGMRAYRQRLGADSSIVVLLQHQTLPELPQLRLLIGSHSTGARRRARNAAALAAAGGP